MHQKIKKTLINDPLINDPIGLPKILKGRLHGPAKEAAMGIYKRPDSKKWWISYYLNGERVREGVSTNKREAEKVLMQRLTAINENKHPEKKGAR